VEFVSIPVVGVHGVHDQVKNIFKEGVPVRVSLEFGGDAEEFKEEDLNSSTTRHSSFASQQAPVSSPASRISQSRGLLSPPSFSTNEEEEKVERMKPEKGGFLSFIFGGKETPTPYTLLANKAKKRNMNIDFTLFYELNIAFGEFFR